MARWAPFPQSSLPAGIEKSIKLLCAVPTRATATAATAALIIRDLCPRSGTGFPPRAADTPHESQGQYAQRMRAIEATVRELLAAAQAAHKAKLDPGRVDTRFVVGDRVLLRTKELLDAADTDLRPRWVGPFTVVACPGPNAYTLALPRNMRCSPTVNVERLKPFFERVDALPPPGPVSDAGQEGEHEVELFLNCRLVRGVTQYLVRWRGHASPADAWLRVEELDHCRELMVEYDAIAPSRCPSLTNDSQQV
jgi:hypothetical protein